MSRKDGLGFFWGEITVQKLEYWYQERDAARVSRIASLIDSSISSSE